MNNYETKHKDITRATNIVVTELAYDSKQLRTFRKLILKIQILCDNDENRETLYSLGTAISTQIMKQNEWNANEWNAI